LAKNNLTVSVPASVRLDRVVPSYYNASDGGLKLAYQRLESYVPLAVK
jgi:hypothetical protein